MAAMVNKDPVDAILDLAIDEELETGFLMAGGNSDLSLLAKAIQLPNVMIGLSDAGAHVDQLCNAGITTYLLHEWVNKRHVLTLERAVQRVTSEPAAFFGFSNKGRIAPGFDAAMVLFDPEPVRLGPQKPRNDLPGGQVPTVHRR